MTLNTMVNRSQYVLDIAHHDRGRELAPSGTTLVNRYKHYGKSWRVSAIPLCAHPLPRTALAALSDHPGQPYLQDPRASDEILAASSLAPLRLLLLRRRCHGQLFSIIATKISAAARRAELGHVPGRPPGT